MSGDPALLLPRPDVVAEDGLIALNLGFGDDDLWGKDPAMVAQELSSAVRHLSVQGHRFVGILMNRDDRRWSELALNGVAADVVVPPDACAAARELSRCSVAIVSRLHAGILAAVSGTPVVSLEYLPKCRDFALSIDDERSLIRTDRLSSTSVVDGVGSALADASTIRARTEAAVATLRRRLQASTPLFDIDWVSTANDAGHTYAWLGVANNPQDVSFGRARGRPVPRVPVPTAGSIRASCDPRRRSPGCCQR